MKKSVLLVTIFGLLSVSYSILPSSDAPRRSIVIEDEKSGDNEKSQMKRFCSQYCASVVLSGCIGAVTGGCVRWLEKQLNFESSPIALFLYLLSWSLESEFRDELVGALQKDLDAHSIGYRKNLMFRTAQIASWMMYLREYA
jgi:hypothetical protein